MIRSRDLMIVAFHLLVIGDSYYEAESAVVSGVGGCDSDSDVVCCVTPGHVSGSDSICCDS